MTEMINFLIYVLGTIGMSHIIVDGSIFETPRNYIIKTFPNSLGKLISCYACTGFWCGIIAGLICFTNIGLIFLCGCAGSFLSSTGALFLNILETKIVIDNNYNTKVDE